MFSIRIFALIFLCIAGFAGYILASTNSSKLLQQYGECQFQPENYGWELMSQGWSTAERQQYWFTSQGSQLIPRDLFLALEQPETSTAFAATDHMASFGFILPGRGNCNPDNLPIGMAYDRETSYIGITCAACHTGVIELDKRRYLIDGAPANLNLNYFMHRLRSAVSATLNDQERWQRFWKRLERQDNVEHETRSAMQQLESRLAAFEYYLSVPGLTNWQQYPGYARVDAMGAIFNKVSVGGLNQPDNFRPSDAPTSYPFLWGAVQADITQWNGSVPNGELFGPLARNVGEAIGMFGEIDFTSTGIGYSSNVDIAGLHQIEQLLAKLQAPRWPSWFPEIDQKKSMRGRTLFLNHCSRCHHEPAAGQSDAVLVSISDVGTDDTLLRNGSRLVKTGVLQGRTIGPIGGREIATEEKATDVLIHAISGVIMKDLASGLVAGNYTGAESVSRPQETIVGYKARSLQSIWATAPYLHNGSVPNLAALLEPASLRPKQFFVGNTKFDPINIGFSVDKTASASLFDTSQPGSSNQGHNYGVELTHEEKFALIEYLKSI